MSQTTTIFTLWHDNKISGRREYEAAELLALFAAFLEPQTPAFFRRNTDSLIVRLFLNGTDGMNSSFTESEFGNFYKLLSPMIADRTQELREKLNTL